MPEHVLGRKTKMNLPQTGGCLCRKIRNEITETPQLVYTCVYRKLRFGRIGDVTRRPGRATQCVRSAELGERPAHPSPTRDEFSPCCNRSHRILEIGASAARSMLLYGQCTRAGSIRSAVPRSRSATASPAQWACRGYPWPVIPA